MEMLFIFGCLIWALALLFDDDYTDDDEYHGTNIS